MPASTAQPGELREDDDFTTALYRAAIGPVSTPYYLAVFSAWESSSRWRPRWNSAAGLWTLGWLAFRKMGGVALAYVGALVGSVLIVFGIGRLFFDLSETGQILMLLLWFLIAVLVPGLWGNVWFHHHCRKRMAIALAAHTEVADSCAALARQSSAPRRILAVGTVQVSMLVALGLGALQFSSLLQHAGIKFGAVSSTTPQMASGRVKDMPVAVASAPVVAVAALPPVTVPPASTSTSTSTSTSASTSASAATPVAAVPKVRASSPAATAKASVPVSVSVSAPVVVAVTPTKTAPRPASSVATPVTVAVAGRYGVNVGLFAKEANAKGVQAKLEAAQLPTRVDTLKMQRGPRTRIRVGPFASQAQADEAAVKIRALGLEAMTYQD